MAGDSVNNAQSAIAVGKTAVSNVREAACDAPDCLSSAAGALEQQAWCVEHFLARSYAGLEKMEQLISRSFTREERGCQQAHAFLEECSLQTLQVCLRSERLSNLERGRLLDVLLWAGELTAALPPATKFERRAGSDEDESAAIAS